MATSSHNRNMTPVGIRELKDNLSHYVRRVEAGERLVVTANGRVVAELGPPANAAGAGRVSRLQALIATGAVEPPSEPGAPMTRWPSLRLPAGTIRELIDADRGDA